MALVGVVRLTTDFEQTKNLVSTTLVGCLVLAGGAALSAQFADDPGVSNSRAILVLWMCNGLGVVLAVKLVARLLLDQGILPRLVVRRRGESLWVSSPLEPSRVRSLEASADAPLEVGLSMRALTAKYQRGYRSTVVIEAESGTIALVMLTNHPESMREQVMEGLRELGVPSVRQQVTPRVRTED